LAPDVHIVLFWQAYSDRIEAVFVAYDLYKKGMESLRIGSLSEAVPALQSCYQIRSAFFNQRLVKN
jgi:hypothetical protein